MDVIKPIVNKSFLKSINIIFMINIKSRENY